jgi:hypothetical protein
MSIYKIIDLSVSIKPIEQTLKKQLKRYETEGCGGVDISIDLTTEQIKQKQLENPHLTLDECEYIWTGAEFYHKLLDFEGFMLHASAVAKDNKAYLFSAQSGTGKSTHTELWQRYFGEDEACIINDDKPAIRYVDKSFYVYGTPWSGKTDKNLNRKVPLQGIVFLEQAEKNWIKQIDSKEALKLILEQTLRPKQLEKIDKLLILLDKLLKTTPVYKMGCNISEDAVKLAYETIK